MRIIRGDPTFIRRVELNLGSNWQLRKQSAPDVNNEFSTGFETSWGAIQSKDREILLVFADESTQSHTHTLKVNQAEYVSEVFTYIPEEHPPMNMKISQELPIQEKPQEIFFTYVMNGVEYKGLLTKNN